LIMNSKVNSIYSAKKLAVFDLDETLVHCVTKNIHLADVQLVITSTMGNAREQYKVIKSIF
jgi:phosphoserine phosphatase